MADFTNIKAVIFDFDGTLYCKKHSAIKIILAAPRHILKMRAERACRRQLKGKYFGSEQAFFEAFIQLFSKKTKLNKEKAATWYKELYLPLMIKNLEKNYSAFPSVQAVFKGLRANGIKTFVYSDYPCVDQRMKAIDLEPGLADALFNSEELGGLKPAVEPFLQISKEIGIAPENILVVGDRLDTDGKGAQNAGMQFSLVQNNLQLATCFAQFLPC